MKRAFVALAILSLTAASSGSAVAAPKRPICADIGPSFGVGVSRFGAVGNWDEAAVMQYGAKWQYLYWYLLPTTNPPADVASWIQGNVQIAKSVNAIPVFTFYELLKLGQNQGIGGSEPQVVQQSLQDAGVMSSYFDHFIFVMKTLANASTPVIVQVEPDTWGFMIWAMGVDGNNDATSVPVKVGGSGHPDVAGFADHAGGLGKALLKLRDQYAPAVRLGWHASNFRTGTGGDIVAQFYSSMGEWDALFSEHPHVEGDPKQWWLPWDDAKVTQNLQFFSTLTAAAHVPILLWQEQVGSTDFHLLSSDPVMRTRFAQAGVAGVLFSMRGSGNPDDFRADEEPDLATVPPAQSMAGGTAKDMRTRVAAYAMNPLSWPGGSVCVGGSGAPGSTSSASSGSSSGNGSGNGNGSGSGSGGGSGSGSGGGQGGGGTGGGTGPFGCSVRGAMPEGSSSAWITIGAAGAILSLGRRRSRRAR